MPSPHPTTRKQRNTGAPPWREFGYPAGWHRADPRNTREGQLDRIETRLNEIEVTLAAILAELRGRRLP